MPVPYTKKLILSPLFALLFFALLFSGCGESPTSLQSEETRNTAIELGNESVAIKTATTNEEGTETGNATEVTITDTQNALYGKVLLGSTDRFKVHSAKIKLGRIEMQALYPSEIYTIEQSVADLRLLGQNDDFFDVLGILGPLSEGIVNIHATFLHSKELPSVNIELKDDQDRSLRFKTNLDDRFGYYFESLPKYGGNRFGIIFDIAEAIDLLDLSEIILSEGEKVLNDSNSPDLMAALLKSLITTSTLVLAGDVEGQMDLREVESVVDYGFDMTERAPK